jgi:hypothetical protein
MVDQLYGITLLMSLACGVAAVAVALMGRIQAVPVAASARLVVPAAVGAWIALLVSFTVHLAWGHAPGSPQALPPLEFLRDHLSFIVAAMIPSVALIVRPKGTRESSTP